MRSRLANQFQARKYGDKYAVVTNLGDVAYLDEQDYRALNFNRLNPEQEKQFEQKHLIITEQNMPAIIADYRRRNIHLFVAPTLHIIVVTRRCNQACEYCHASSQPMHRTELDMSLATAQKTVDFILQSPAPELAIEFQGGEPLANVECIKFIVNYAKEKAAGRKLNFYLVTNLTLMTEELLDYFMKEGVQISTSFDGPQRLHNSQRGQTYELVTKWIRRIKEKGAPVGALATITRQSLPLWKEIVDEYVKLGLSSVWFRPASRIGRAATAWNKISCTAEEFFSAWKSAVEYIVDNKLPIQESTAVIMTKKMSGINPMFLDMQSPTGEATGQLAYDHDGGVYSSDEGRMFEEDLFRLGSVHENTFNEVMKSPKVAGLVAASITDGLACNACIFKPFCGQSLARNYANHGTIIAPLALDTRCQLLLKQFDFILGKLANDEQYREVLAEWTR